MKFSIITINYNNCEGLRRTIESVVNQTCRDFEYIIIDGGSTDGSVDVIKQYADQIDYWVSEPDKGIYNAMNKGVAVAKGEYCLFMNSGDTFYTNDVIKQVYKKADFRSDIIVGDHDSSGEIVSAPEEITGVFLYKNTLCHQSVFIRKMLLDENPYDETYIIAADWYHLFDSLILKNAKYSHVNVVICYYENNGLSKKLWRQLISERNRAIDSMLPKRISEDYKMFVKAERIERLSPQVISIIDSLKPGSIDEKVVLMSKSLLNKLRRIKKLLKRNKMIC